MPSDTPDLGDTRGAGALRATAHPTRLDILDLLSRHPALTATECARVLGLSAKTCSYHLRMLAAHGYVEEVPAAGRLRPWRRTAARAGLGGGRVPAAPAGLRGGHPPAEQVGAGRADDRALKARQRRDGTLLGGAIDAMALAAAVPDWSVAATVHHRVARMTPAELAAWVEDVERLTRRHVRRSAFDDGAHREEVALLFYGFPSAMARR